MPPGSIRRGPGRRRDPAGPRLGPRRPEWGRCRGPRSDSPLTRSPLPSPRSPLRPLLPTHLRTPEATSGVREGAARGRVRGSENARAPTGRGVCRQGARGEAGGRSQSRPEARAARGQWRGRGTCRVGRGQRGTPAAGALGKDGCVTRATGEESPKVGGRDVGKRRSEPPEARRRPAFERRGGSDATHDNNKH